MANTTTPKDQTMPQTKTDPDPTSNLSTEQLDEIAGIYDDLAADATTDSAREYWKDARDQITALREQRAMRDPLGIIGKVDPEEFVGLDLLGRTKAITWDPAGVYVLGTATGDIHFLTDAELATLLRAHPTHHYRQYVTNHPMVTRNCRDCGSEYLIDAERAQRAQRQTKWTLLCGHCLRQHT